MQRKRRAMGDSRDQAREEGSYDKDNKHAAEPHENGARNQRNGTVPKDEHKSDGKRSCDEDAGKSTLWTNAGQD